MTTGKFKKRIPHQIKYRALNSQDLDAGKTCQNIAVLLLYLRFHRLRSQPFNERFD